MMNAPYTSALILLLILASATSAIAQIPRTMSYQGVLTDATGTFVPEGLHLLKLSIYDNVTAPTPIFTETQAVPVIRGIFNVIIGNLTPIPESLQFDRAYFLGVSVDGGIELSPRTPLAAAPYALHAAIADKAMSLDPNVSGVVTTINGASGPITLVGSGGTTINTVGNTVSISSSGGGGTGIQGVQNSDGTLQICNPNGPTATINIADNGITGSKLADNSVSSAKIIDGAIQGPDVSSGAITLMHLNSGAATSGQVLSATGGGGVSWMTSAGGLTLPYLGTVNATNSFPDAAFRIVNTNATSGGAGSFQINNATNTGSALTATTTGTGSALRAEVSAATSAAAVYAHSTGSSVGVAGSFVNDNAANTNGAVTIVSNATNTRADGLFVRTTGGAKAGSFLISNTASTSDAVYSETNGTGAAIHGSNVSTTWDVFGVLGEASSTQTGTVLLGVSGVVGKIVPTTPGSGSAGVRGINNGVGGQGAGVIGYQAGSGYGVMGVTPNGIGVDGLASNTIAINVGVRGQTNSPNGVGVDAAYNGTGSGTALRIGNGYIKVGGTNRTAFTHTVAAGNASYQTSLSYVGMASTDILIVTPVWTSVYYTAAWSIYWDGSLWAIFSQNQSTVIPGGMRFNVLVIKQ